MSESPQTTGGDRFLLCADNLADPRVVEYQFKDCGEVLERGTAISLRYVTERFDAFKARRMRDSP